ncbi:aminotransferase class V-fold PLP-dependent enzyme [Sediminitomix flava]|uniref:Phosphoserine aminotransferase n=1 Tax=Sediminitomix flava TaxID=379075 RepID=A0A315ZER1_SEDFL|nr:aminotransferase class V-fold PLP-dependent enzyme [Sediminitomix flava]PWJ44086.1 phosphoserine aminotransferase [Sediminitomix flava]
MISFYPGPSKVYPQVKEYMMEAMDTGILSCNHRSPEFVDLSKETIKLLKKKLDIPKNYTIFFLSSATECWEVLSESYKPLFSTHIYNGAFGEKWYLNKKKLDANAMAFEYPIHREISVNKLSKLNSSYTEAICLTPNETSNATKVSKNMMHKVRQRFKKSLIMTDVTSSLGGVDLDWLSADIWYASVQKCLGLPAGMALMICSPRAIEKALELNENKHYNSMVAMIKQMERFQTTHTPNVLNIFLLNKVMQMRDPIKRISNQTKTRMQSMQNVLQKNGYEPLIPYTRLRSDTVLAIKDNASRITEIKKKAKKEGFVLGNGYGDWKENTFRIANFPAITNDEITQLVDFLKLNA